MSIHLRLRAVLETPASELSLDEYREVLRQLMHEVAQSGNREWVEQVFSVFIEREILQRQQRPLQRIFQNARSTTARTRPTPAGVSTLRCSSCGAPREGEARPHCQYCGTSFFPKEI